MPRSDVESQLVYDEDDLRSVRKEIAISERAPLEHRLVDEEEWRQKLDRLRAREAELIRATAALSSTLEEHDLECDMDEDCTCGAAA